MVLWAPHRGTIQSCQEIAAITEAAEDSPCADCVIQVCACVCRESKHYCSVACAVLTSVLWYAVLCCGMLPQLRFSSGLPSVQGGFTKHDTIKSVLSFARSFFTPDK